jgi:hypothetical protein
LERAGHFTLLAARANYEITGADLEQLSSAHCKALRTLGRLRELVDR